ncbi:MAG: hypothetical protein KF845_11015 [Cyclobacteriaceae bacterium]|nr:hypothetical protein [Cyclobacteriaceae bacterium]
MTFRMKILCYGFTALIFFGLTNLAYAQDEGGEIKPVEIEIVKEREITLPPANRLFDKIPPRPAERISPEISYSFKTLQFNTPEVVTAIRPLRLKQEQSADVNAGFISMGYGNYASPYLEAFFNTKEDKDKLLGVHAFHNSSGKGPVDGRNSGSGNSGLSVFAESFGKEITLQANAGFENFVTHFYGYPSGMEVSRDTIRQAYNVFKLGVGLANARNTAFSYGLGGNFSFLKDKFDAAESTIDLNFKSSYKLEDDKSIELHADYTLISRKDAGLDAKGRSLFQLNPFYAFMLDDIKFRIGAVAALENDTLDSHDFHFFPDVQVTYPISHSVDLVGSLTGGVDRVSLQSLMRQNRWLGPAIPIYHTNRLFDLQAMVNARLTGNLFVNTGFSFATLNNLYFFVNDAENQSKFTTVFDTGSTKRANFFAAANLNYGNKARLTIRGDYFSYGTDSQAEAWHRPGYSFSLNGLYNLKGKIAFSTDIMALGGIRALSPTLQTVKLDPAFDLNFRMEYFVSDKFTVFLDFNNVTGNNYQVFWHYPVRGFQVMGGITWSF